MRRGRRRPGVECLPERPRQKSHRLVRPAATLINTFARRKVEYAFVRADAAVGRVDASNDLTRRWADDERSENQIYVNAADERGPEKIPVSSDRGPVFDVAAFYSANDPADKLPAITVWCG